MRGIGDGPREWAASPLRFAIAHLRSDAAHSRGRASLAGARLSKKSRFVVSTMGSTSKDPPKVAPKLNDMIRMIASLGGYVIRKKTEPGTQTLWFGLQRMHDFASCYDSFGPDSRKR